MIKNYNNNKGNQQAIKNKILTQLFQDCENGEYDLTVVLCDSTKLGSANKLQELADPMQ